MKLPLFFVVLICLYHCSSGKIFTRCELARELVHQGFPVNKLPDWVCLVENESGRNTGIKSKQNTNKSYDWGLFQINDKYWCQPGSPGNDCKVKCEDLLTDDITVASDCAKKIYKRQKFRAWYGWIANCQGALPDLSKCF